MKKWHMEGIVGISDNRHQKLIVPDLKMATLWSGNKGLTMRKEYRVIAVLRRWVGLLLRHF